MVAITPHGRRARRPILIATLSAVAVLIAGCASASAPQSPTASVTNDARAETTTLRTIIESATEKPTLRIGEEVDAAPGVTSWAVTYDSGGKTISGILRIPEGEGPFPAVAVVHGGVDPDVYRSGRDMEAEQRALVESGYVVFATDLRGYAGSDPADPDSVSFDPDFGWTTVLDWGMALDVVNALAVLRSGQVAAVDPERVGVLGHSLGGLLAIDSAVIAPGSADVVVAQAATTTALGEVIEAYAADDSDLFDEVSGSVGMPADNPEFWADISPRTFFDRATAPLVLIHGGDDEVAPALWSQQTATVWREAGGEVEVVILDGADHALTPRRAEAVQLTVAAFDAVIGG